MSEMRTFWSRLLARRKAGAVERRAEYERRTPAERRIVDESIEDRTSESAAEEWLGGSDPQRLLNTEESPRD